VQVNIDANEFRILQFIVRIAAATEAAEMKIQYNNLVGLDKPGINESSHDKPDTMVGSCFRSPVFN
jgi:hypothetical protein